MGGRREEKHVGRHRPYAGVARTFRGRPLTFIAFLVVSLYVICILTVMIGEKVAFPQALLVLMPSIFGELGDVEAKPADIAAVLSLAVYALLVAMIFGKVGEVVVQRALKGGIPVRRMHHKGHVLICGWNSQGKGIVGSVSF